MLTTKQVLAVVGMALGIMGLVLGLVPAVPGENPCGSPFIVDGDASDSYLEACETVGGLSDRRAYAIALLLGGAVFFLGSMSGAMTSDTDVTSSRGDRTSGSKEDSGPAPS